MELWSALLIGLFGSLHCAGMCGPLVIALPSGQQSRTAFILSRLIYNSGRVITYSFIGFVFGVFGSGVSLFGLQQNLSIALGVIILLAVLLPYKYRSKLRELPLIRHYSSGIKSSFGRFIGKDSQSSMFVLGLLNGFLPCGLVYVALAGAMVTSGALHGMAFMALFGAGTFPVMFAVTIFGKFINLNLRRKLARMIPVFTLMLALILILRGLDLGIPYLSPRLHNAAQVTQTNSPEPDCCR